MMFTQNRNYLLLFYVVGFSALLEAQSHRIDQPLQVQKLSNGWILAEGEAHVTNITPEEARRRALQDARERAIMFANLRGRIGSSVGF